MLKPCEDNFSTMFSTYDAMQRYHEGLSSGSQWHRCKVKELHIEPLDKASGLYASPASFASGVSTEAIEDTVQNLGLAVQVGSEYYPIRMTAYKSLLDRAKISGTALAKLSREQLAEVLNNCLGLFSSETLLLIRNEKVSAAHSGDETDYSILPIDKLLEALTKKLDDRFPGSVFEGGYCDHAITSATWTLAGQKEDLLGTYEKVLIAQGKTVMASKLMPGIRFVTSDTGVASAKVSAMLMGTQHPIHIGGCVAVDHRHQAKVEDFETALDQLFAQFGDSILKLQKLLEIHLDYPVNAMTRICKKLSLPKKAAVEAIAMYEMAYGSGYATAHDVFMAMQEIPYLLKSGHTPESKMLFVEENMARALTLRWSDYDLAKAVSY